jgi:indolepyruvate ferredoxin oxidoreductase beta subunit
MRLKGRVNDMKTNVLIVGVGGQGTLLASRLLGNVALRSGVDVKVSEVHGMSQRGGSVVTYVRFGDELYSPIVEEGQADYMLAFELLEARRYAHYMKPGGLMIVNDQQILPMPVVTGAMQYPSDLKNELQACCAHVLFVDALGNALNSGSEKAVNTVLMGVLAKRLPFEIQEWEKTLEEIVPPRFLNINKKAFAAGVGL